MYLKGVIGHLKVRIFGLVPAEQRCDPQEMNQLAEAIMEYGRMRQEHYGSPAILVGAGEVAMRLRETPNMIARAIGVLREQGGAEETGVHGRWRLRLVVPVVQGPGDPNREVLGADS